MALNKPSMSHHQLISDKAQPDALLSATYVTSADNDHFDPMASASIFQPSIIDQDIMCIDWESFLDRLLQDPDFDNDQMTAPNPITSGSAVVFANNDAESTIMREFLDIFDVERFFAEKATQPTSKAAGVPTISAQRMQLYDNGDEEEVEDSSFIQDCLKMIDFDGFDNDSDEEEVEDSSFIQECLDMIDFDGFDNA